MINLNAIDLVNNNLTDLDLSLFKDLSTLVNLYLSNNQLTLKVDNFIGLTNLRTLYINANQLSKLNVGVFNRLRNLANLELTNNMLD